MVLNGIRTLHQKKTRRPPCTHPLPFDTLRHLTSHHPSQPNLDEFLSSFIFPFTRAFRLDILPTYFFSLHTYSHLANSSHHLRFN
jgi:hypothetical protein